ncbi:MAG TPA: hypothetical protein VHY30_05715 [Verrucomicrobiae bacterium]|nr:hypothetical protein [Verrucomicrobiae bacterium]
MRPRPKAKKQQLSALKTDITTLNVVRRFPLVQCLGQFVMQRGKEALK